GYARGQALDRSAEPLQMVEAVGNEIAQYSAAIVAHRFPVAHAHLDGAALDMPMHGDMAQCAGGAGIEHGLRSLPSEDLMEIEIDHGRLAAHRSLSEHGPALCQDRSQEAFRRIPVFRAAGRELRAAPAGLAAWRSRQPARPCPRPAHASRHRLSARWRLAQARPCARNCCRPAQSPRSVNRHGMVATPGFPNNWSPRWGDGSRCDALPNRILPCAAWI